MTPFCYVIVIVSPKRVKLHTKVLKEGYHLDMTVVTPAAEKLGLSRDASSAHSLGDIASVTAVIFIAARELGPLEEEVFLKVVEEAVLTASHVQGTLSQISQLESGPE